MVAMKEAIKDKLPVGILNDDFVQQSNLNPTMKVTFGTARYLDKFYATQESASPTEMEPTVSTV